MEAEKARQVAVLLACQSSADLRRLQREEPPSFPLIILACKHNRADLLNILLENQSSSSDGAVASDPHWGSVDQEYEGHDATYYAIRSSNVELLRALLKTVTAVLWEQRLSKSYEKLLLNKVLVSEEMHLYIQYKLHHQRFFSKCDRVSTVTSSTNIQERIQLLVENIKLINTYKEVDSQFLYVAKFIAQNIHILKNQLKSTYDRLPWEEMEFCLVSFVTAHIQRQELNIFYLTVLTEKKLLEELEKFATDLQDYKLVEHIKSTSVQDLRKPLGKTSNREDVATTISKRYPDLYADYKEVRDISSLHIMKTYLDAALRADSATRLGQLTIKRALQVTGEHLKNTLDSPNLSPAVSDLLFLSAPKDPKQVLHDLRNSLSKSRIESAGKQLDSEQYASIQFVIQKIASVITDITKFKIVNKIKCLLNIIIYSYSVEKIQEIANVLQNVNDLEDVQETKVSTKDHWKIKYLISSIKDQTPHEKKLFVEIKDVLDNTNLQHQLTTGDYSILKAIVHHSSVIRGQSTEVDGNLIQEMKNMANRVLENFPPNIEIERRNLLDNLLTRFYNSVSMRIKPEIAFGIKYAIARIKYAILIDERDFKCIVDYSEQEKWNVRYVQNHTEEIGKDLTLKLTELGHTIGTDRICGQVYEHFSLLYKDKTANRFTVEGLVLDSILLLQSYDCIPFNLLYLDGDMPLLNGKCLRNHLAHGNALVEILPTEAWYAVLLNAVKLNEKKDLLLNCKIGSIITHNIKQLRWRYERGLSILDKQKEMWKSLLDGNFEKFASGITGGADIYSRTVDLSSTLHYAAQGSNIQTVKFLIKQNMISTEVRDINGQTVLHVAAAFGRDVTVKFLVAEMGNAIDQVDNAGKTPLHLASQNGQKETVKTLLSLRAKITVKDSMGHSPLYYAIQKNFLDVVNILLNATVDKNTLNEDTYLHTAAANGHIEIVECLLLNKADINAKTDQGTIPLHLAAANGHLKVVESLLEKGAHVNFRDRTGHSPLYNAVTSSHEDVVKTLLEKGAFVNYEDVTHDCSPFHLAVSNGDAIIVDLLLEHNTNVNAKIRGGLTPLLLAAEGGHANIVNLLLQKRALADSRDDDGKTALHFAAGSGHTSVVEILIQRKVEVDTKNTNKVTPLHLAARAGHLQVVVLLLAEGAKSYSASDEGVTALHLSAANGHEAISEALMKNGANRNCKDNSDNTPLHSAATKTCNERTIQMLLKYGANINEAGQINRTALHVASFIGNSSAVEALLQEGADVNAKDNDGATALHLAVTGNHKAAVEILLEDEYKAKVNLLDNTSSSALCCAARNNNKDLLDILIKKGADVNVGKGKLLLTAVKAGYRPVVRALLRNKDIDINIKDQNGLNLLYTAAGSGDELIASELIARGIKIADCVKEPSPLFIAISLGHTSFVKLLLDKGVNVNPTDPNFSPLYTAVHMNKPDILKILLDREANSNIRNKNNITPLELAVARAQTQNTSILLQHVGDRINERGNENRTLLHIAATVGNLEVTKLLVGKGADIKDRLGDTKDRLGDQPIHIAARHGHHNILGFFLQLIDDRGSLSLSIDDRGSDECTLMHCAAAEGQLATVQYLIDKHADINSTDVNGSMPIHCSAEQGHTEMVKLLLQSGAVYDARNNLGITPAELTENRDIKEVFESIGKLFNAVKTNDVVIINTMIENLTKYSNVQSFDNENATLLHIASERGFNDVCDILLKSKANPNAVGKDGETPLHYASKHSHPGIVESLLKKGAVHNLKSVNSKTPLDFATHKDIKYLLKIVALCFQKVQFHDVMVIEDITKIRDTEIIKAVMKAGNTDGDTLVVVAMKNGFPNIAELKQVLQPLAPHFLSVVEIMFTSEKFTEALNILKQLLNERIKTLGEDNPGTLDIQYKTAMVMFKQSKYSETKTMLEDIHRKRVAVFGPRHPDSLKTRSSLALLLHRLGRNTEARDILKEILPIQETVLNEEHEELLQTKTRAGLVQLALGKHEDALHLHTQVYKIHKNKLVTDHTDTLLTQRNIAIVLHAQGKLHEAFAMFKTIYEKMKSNFSPNHSETLKARSSMATILISQLKQNEAAEILSEILAIQLNLSI